MEYLIKRSKRKTLSMHFSHDGKLIVNAPLSATAHDIESFVARHEGWIEKMQGERARIPTFADGERIPVMGESYTIASGPRAMLKDGCLYLPREGRLEALKKFFCDLTRKRMKCMLDELCAAYDFTYTKLSVTSARGRWGSCSASGHISFSFRGAFLPDELARYLAVHELCHTRSMDHSARFWAEVKKIVPDPRACRAELKKYRWAMNCL